MKSAFYILALLLASAFACKEPGKAAVQANDATKKTLTAEDSVYKQVIAIHDEVMPKMGKLIGYQKRAQHRLDSLEEFMMRARMTQVAAKAVGEKKDSLNSLIFDLKLSEKAMNDWMSQFNPDPKMATPAAQIAYFEDQRGKAQKMRDRFFASLDKAKNMLGD